MSSWRRPRPSCSTKTRTRTAMNNLPPAAYTAMVVQAKRLHREPTPQEVLADRRVQLTKAQNDLVAAQDEINRLNSVIETQQASVVHSATVNAADSGLFINGRKVVNQVDAAKLLGVKQYQISRWLKAGKFEKVAV